MNHNEVTPLELEYRGAVFPNTPKGITMKIPMSNIYICDNGESYAMEFMNGRKYFVYTGTVLFEKDLTAGGTDHETIR